LKDKINEYWSKGAEGYNSYVNTSLSCKKETEAWQDIFSKVLGTEKLNILDVGTGPGIIALQLAKLGHTVTAVDLSEEMLDKAEKNSREYSLDICFRKGDAEALPFPDNSFDAVVNRFVLWTVPSPEKALTEWGRVLKKGGTIAYIDGNWHSDLADSPLRKIWYYIGRFLTMITERRNPFGGKLDSEVSANLWSRNVLRPDADVEMLKKLGYSSINILNGLKKRTLPGIQYVKYGFWSDFFMVYAKK
jgi:ubiquinone/menaquinone biosynthesis C-methylase UbiE